METAATICIAFLFFLLRLTSAQQEPCGSIGSSNETAAMPSGAEQFYLNTANPAPCTGNITSWRVCYYGPDSITSGGSYWATYAVYRRMESGSNVHYKRVSEMFRAVRTIAPFTGEDAVDGEIVQGNFSCYDDSIDVGDSPLTIQAGDILGACIFDPDGNFLVNRLPLDIIGEASGETLLQMDTTGCSRDAIPSNISISELSALNSRRLHIYANIEAELPTMQTASIPPTTTAVTMTDPATAAVTMTDPATAAVTVTDPTTVAGTTTVTTNSLIITLTSEIPNSTIATTIDLSTTSNTKGSQTDRVVAIVAGSAGGGFIVLLLLVAIIFILSKRKGYNLSTNVEYSKSKTSDVVTLKTNAAYNSIQHTESANIELEVVYDTADLGESTADHQLQELTESGDSKLNMEHDVAYESSAAAQISRNVAYDISHKSGGAPDSNDYGDDKYDYIQVYSHSPS